jgi:GH18 family chitinase
MSRKPLTLYLQDIYTEYFATDIPASELTHIIYSFANINSTTGDV